LFDIRYSIHGTKVTGGVADHCPPLAGGRGVDWHK